MPTIIVFKITKFLLETSDEDDDNEVFLPVYSFLSEKSYQLEIYTRWGELIFTSTTRDTPWTGANYDTGLYLYKLQYSDPKGQKRIQSGQVHLIK